MEIERWDGCKETREYKNIRDMMKDAKKEGLKPETKTLTLRFPKLIIPSKRRKRSAVTVEES